MSDIDDQIESEASKAAETVVDGTKVKRRPLGELVEAAQYLASADATANNTKTRGLTFSKFRPPGTS